jgi:hypothetical protein
MRAQEFVAESSGKLRPNHSAAMKTAHAFRDNGVDRAYNLNRMMMAAAMHDGKSKKAVDMNSGSWSEKYNTAHPYTEEENNMVRGALKTVGADHHTIVSDRNSTESDDVHRISPVKGFKGYAR